MLRRKLLLILGLLLSILLVAAVCSTLLLHNVLDDLDHISSAALTGTTRVGILGSSITRVEGELNALRLEREGHLDELIDRVELLERQVADLDEFYVMNEDGKTQYAELRRLLPIFRSHVGNLATTPDPELSARHTEEAIMASTEMREVIADLSVIAQEHAEQEQQAVTVKFRWMGGIL